jgi:hypothetical protein
MCRQEVIMGPEPESPETLADDAMRSFALGRAAAVSRYGSLLTRYGKGELQPVDLAQESLKLAFEESIRYAQDTALLGSAFLAALAKVGRPEDQPSTPAADTPAPTKARTPSRKK